MLSPITWPLYEQATNCLALFGTKPFMLLMARLSMSFSASGPSMKRSTMWCVWSNSTAALRHAACSSRQFENSGATTG